MHDAVDEHHDGEDVGGDSVVGSDEAGEAEAGPVKFGANVNGFDAYFNFDKFVQNSVVNPIKFYVIWRN